MSLSKERCIAHPSEDIAPPSHDRGSTHASQDLSKNGSHDNVIVAPIERLPIDVLPQIFSQTLPISGYSGRPHITVPIFTSSAPWALRSVCSSWRRLALGQRNLWNRILVYPPSVYDRRLLPNRTGFGGIQTPWSRCLTAVEQVLPMDGLVTMELYLIESPPIFVESAFKQLIAPYSNRLRELCLICDDSKFRLATSLLIPAYLENVEILDIQFRDMYLGPHSIGTPDIRMFDHAKQLTSLRIEARYYLFWPLFRVNIPWAHIRHLDLTLRSEPSGAASHSEFLGIFEKCQNLETCFLNIEFLHRETTLPSKVTLPTLRSLTFHLPLKSMELDILDSLVLPSLKELTIYRQQDQTTDGVIAMLKQSACDLETFTEKIAGIFETERLLAESDYLPYHDLLPLLSSVRIFSTVSPMTKAHIEAVALGDVLPNVQTLKCCSKISPLTFISALQPRFELESTCTLFSLSLLCLNSSFDHERQRMTEIWSEIAKKHRVTLELR